MRIFLDANVVFSAANERSSLGKVILSLADDHELIVNPLVIHEAHTNLKTKRPDWLPAFETLKRVLQLVRDATNSEIELLGELELADKDRPILAAAFVSGSDLLVTGDRRHFGHLFDQNVRGVEILSVSGLFARLADTA